MTDKAREFLERALQAWEQEDFISATESLMEEVQKFLAEPEVKREALSAEEVIQAYEDASFIGTMTAFVAGIRFAEKHHGIGGGDENTNP